MREDVSALVLNSFFFVNRDMLDHSVKPSKMYGANWCGDCRRADKFFVDNKINFQKVDLELN